MSEDFAAIRKQLGNVPWLTKKGLDWTKFPIDGVLRQIVQGSEKEVDAGLRALRSRHRRGRVEAGIFLLGLLAFSGDDWKQRERIVQALARSWQATLVSLHACAISSLMPSGLLPSENTDNGSAPRLHLGERQSRATFDQGALPHPHRGVAFGYCNAKLVSRRAIIVFPRKAYNEHGEISWQRGA
jgi:hypothetical protein